MLSEIKEYFLSFADLPPRELAGTMLGIALIAVSVFIYISKKRDRIICFKIANDVLYGANNFCFLNYTAGALGLISIFREIVFFYRGKKKWADSRLWLALFLTVSFLTPCVQWYFQKNIDLLQLLSAFGTAFLVLGLFCSDTRVMKVLVIIGQVLYLIYQTQTSNVTASVCAVMSIVSAVCGLVNEFVNGGLKSKREISEKKRNTV